MTVGSKTVNLENHKIKRMISRKTNGRSVTYRNWFFAPVMIAVLLCSATVSLAASIVPTRLRLEYLVQPKGVDEPHPRFGWVLEAVGKKAFGQTQTAYRILVSSTDKRLQQSNGDLWDSGWVASDEMQHITYNGKPLSADRTYHWKVQVKDENGEISRWSAPAEWSTGLFNADEWEGKWIGSDEWYNPTALENNVSDPWFRKTVQLQQKPGKATLFLASVGYHELYVNGKRIGEDVLSPAVADHTKRARYVAYDIADELKRGTNVIAVWLGTSWSIFPPYMLHDDRPATPIVTAQLAIYKEQSPTADAVPIELITTDGSWKTHPSPNKLTGKWDFMKMGGEIWDARREVADWNLPSADESGWKPATVYDVRSLSLSAEKIAPNRLLEEVNPVAVETRSDGSHRVDMGVNFAGWTEVNVSGREADTIRFQYSEREDHDMTHSMHSAFVIGPSGKGTFRNRFNYSSGRWITIRGLKEAPTADDIKGWVIRTNYEDAAHFESADTLQNWIYDRVRWTFENLSLGGYVVDCPQRERMGYGGDAHATSETGMFNYQLGAFYTKWMEDWRDVQGTESMVGNMLDTNHARKAMTSGRILNNGVIPHTAPTYWGGGGPAWGGIVVTLPWFMYQHYGDQAVLERNFALMEGWLDFLQSNTQHDILQRFGGEWDFLGDWLWPDAKDMNNDQPETLCLNNSYYVFNLRTAAKVARVIGRMEEAARWEAQADRSAAATHQLFFNASDRNYADGSMANLAAALLADIPPVGVRDEVMKRLEREIIEVRDGHIHAGITGGALLFKFLRDEGRDDLIYRMVSKTTYPSWGYMRDQGATTIWEAWDADRSGHSLLHSSYLYPGAWYIDGIAGIKRDADHPGFKRFIVRPPSRQATDIAWAKASFDSPVGMIESGWVREDRGGLHLAITVPPNSIGVLQLLPEDAVDVTGYPSIVELGKKGEFLHYELKAGTYLLDKK